MLIEKMNARNVRPRRGSHTPLLPNIATNLRCRQHRFCRFFLIKAPSRIFSIYAKVPFIEKITLQSLNFTKQALPPLNFLVEY